jgi:hypothetical protein
MESVYNFTLSFCLRKNLLYVPESVNVETVVLLSHKNADTHMEEGNYITHHHSTFAHISKNASIEGEIHLSL